MRRTGEPSEWVLLWTQLVALLCLGIALLTLSRTVPLHRWDWSLFWWAQLIGALWLLVAWVPRYGVLRLARRGNAAAQESVRRRRVMWRVATLDVPILSLMVGAPAALTGWPVIDVAYALVVVLSSLVVPGFVALVVVRRWRRAHPANDRVPGSP